MMNPYTVYEIAKMRVKELLREADHQRLIRLARLTSNELSGNLSTDDRVPRVKEKIKRYRRNKHEILVHVHRYSVGNSIAGRFGIEHPYPDPLEHTI